MASDFKLTGFDFLFSHQFCGFFGHTNIVGGIAYARMHITQRTQRIDGQIIQTDVRR